MGMILVYILDDEPSRLYKNQNAGEIVGRMANEMGPGKEWVVDTLACPKHKYVDYAKSVTQLLSEHDEYRKSPD